jgi:hypothetical protein
MYVGYRLKHSIRQSHVDAAEVAIELIHIRRTNDVTGDEWLSGDEGKRHLSWIQPVFAG